MTGIEEVRDFTPLYGYQDPGWSILVEEQLLPISVNTLLIEIKRIVFTLIQHEYQILR